MTVAMAILNNTVSRVLKGKAVDLSAITTTKSI